MSGGSLVVVGSGILAVGQMTDEARRSIETADVVLRAVSDPVSAAWIERLNPVSEDLLRFYRRDEDRREAYRMMVRCIRLHVTAGKKVCAVFYGHPGVFVYPAHEAIRQLRREGYPAAMQPGISAEDCLFASLGVDPLESGCQAFEATDFLVRRRVPDPASCLVLWQVDGVGDNSFCPGGHDGRHVPVLLERLLQWYSPGHEAILYDAPVFPLCPPVILCFPLGELPAAVRRVRGVGTLCLPPEAASAADPDMLERIGLRDNEGAGPARG